MIQESVKTSVYSSLGDDAEMASKARCVFTALLLLFK